MQPPSRDTLERGGRCSTIRGASSSREKWRAHEKPGDPTLMADVERYLEGRHAIVTGGSRGIGAAIAAELVRHGADVTIMGRSAETLERTAAELRGERGATVAVEECNVADGTSVRTAFARATANLGPAYILVNNA